MQDSYFTSLKTGKSYPIVFRDDPPCGADREVFFAPDKSYAIGVFKETPDEQHGRKLDALVFRYRDQVLREQDATERAQWENLFCWPSDVVTKDGFIGVVFPTFPSCFYFHENHTIISKGQEKNVGWFAEPYHKYYHIPPAERGDFNDVLHCALLLAKGVRRLHSLGLIHPDLSHGVLIDPTSRATLITGILDIAIPGLFESEIEGTPEYIAPELIASCGNAKRYTPSQETDKHALAVLIYQLLLCRHPLRGKCRFAADDEDTREMGTDALFIENPHDHASRFGAEWVREGQPPKKHPYLFPWMDLDNLPYTILGPHLSDLIERAFVRGLHNPKFRPTAAEWEVALESTLPLLHPCDNPDCRAKWHVVTGDMDSCCPFCKK